jgi:hypothetical protein
MVVGMVTRVKMKLCMCVYNELWCGEVADWLVADEEREYDRSSALLYAAPARFASIFDATLHSRGRKDHMPPFHPGHSARGSPFTPLFMPCHVRHTDRQGRVRRVGARVNAHLSLPRGLDVVPYDTMIQSRHREPTDAERISRFAR